MEIFFFSFSYQFLLNEISIIWRAFSLPVLEPLTPQRLEKIISITLTCLYTSVTVAMSNTVISLTNPQPTKPSTTKDEEIDNYGNCIVQKSVSLWSICIIVQKSVSLWSICMQYWMCILVCSDVNVSCYIIQ